MSVVDPRLLELLQRYPADLSADEAEQLRAAGAADPRIADLLAGVDALEEARPPAPVWGPADGTEPRLSDVGRARLDQLFADVLPAAGGADRPPEPVADVPAPPVRPRGADVRWLFAAAALIAIGIGLRMVLPSADDPIESQFRGRLGEVDVELVVVGDQPLSSGTERPTGDPVRFQVVTSGEAYLALVETQNGKRALVWPAMGEQWHVRSGVHLLQPEGLSADYSPADPGEATYELIAAPGPLTLTGAGATAEGAITASTFVLRWR